MADSFKLRGYIEGYYGKAHTHQERLGLFSFLKSARMNAYMYAPKDDPLHRGLWRTPYPAADVARFKELVREAKKCGVNFIYAMSPGLDITFTSKKDVQALLNKYLQLKRLGVTHFSLLMDDIPAQLCPADKKAFKRAGVAQAYLGNLVHEKLGGCTLIFCPTEYCSAFARHAETQSQYLMDISALDPDIRAFWTGPQVVAEKITGPLVKDASQTMRRRLVIWDNYHANDYTPSRIFIGPLRGRDASLRKYADGYLTNMTECLTLNKIPLLTVADYALNPAAYDPEASWKKAAARIEPKAAGHLALLKEFYDGPYCYGKKALALAKQMKTGRMTYKEAHEIDETFSDFTNVIKNRDFFSEIFKFLHFLSGDFNIYKRLKDPNRGKDPMFMKWYLTRRNITGVAVDEIVKRLQPGKEA